MFLSHAIECGWFLLQFIENYGEIVENSEEISNVAKNMMIHSSFEKGWDSNNKGGLLYFLDAVRNINCFTEKIWKFFFIPLPNPQKGGPFWIL